MAKKIIGTAVYLVLIIVMMSSMAQEALGIRAGRNVQDVACLQQGDALNVGASLNDVGKDVGNLLGTTIGQVGGRLNVVNGAVGTLGNGFKLTGNLLTGLFNPTCKTAATVNSHTGQLPAP